MKGDVQKKEFVQAHYIAQINILAIYLIRRMTIYKCYITCGNNHAIFSKIWEREH